MRFLWMPAVLIAASAVLPMKSPALNLTAKERPAVSGSIASSNS